MYTPPSTALSRIVTRAVPRIWNRYFRDPSDAAGELADNYFTTLTAANGNIFRFGPACAYLKRMWNTALLSTLTTADYRLALDGGEVDLYNLSAKMGTLKSEQIRDYFAVRYRDLLQYSFRSDVNIDADQRPLLLMRRSQFISGYDVDGTDDATLGQYSGKAFGVCKMAIPRRFFPEHGVIWIMALLRFPPVDVS